MKKKFTRLFFFAFNRALRNIQSAITDKEYYGYHYEFPKIDTFNNGLPHFTHHIYDSGAPKDYKYLLRNDSKYNIKSSTEWKELYNFVKKEADLSKYFNIIESLGVNFDFIEIYLYSIVVNFTEYYIHTTNNHRAIKKTFLKLYSQLFNAIFAKTLSLSICFPIPLVKFDFDSRIIAENIIIKKIPNAIQLSRNDTNASNSNHNLISGASTHYFVLKNWSIPNPYNLWNIHQVLSDLNSFEKPIEYAKKFISSLRIETNLQTGLTQLLTIPDNWVADYDAHLKRIYRINLNEYNHDLEKDGWLINQDIVTKKTISRVINTFKNISSISNNSFILSLDRYNEYYTRKNERDKIIDLTTALESLLTNDSRSEITYRLSNRIAILFKKHNIKTYMAEDILDIVKKIYDYRGAIVHGECKLDKKRTIVLPTKESVQAVELAHHILKEVLQIFIKNKKVYKPSEIDKLLLSC